MKTFKQFVTMINESSRGFGTHSFGMEPSVDSYIKGMNAADQHAAQEAKDLKKRYKDMKGSFKKVKTRYGVHHEGDGEFAGYKVTSHGNGHGTGFGHGHDIHSVSYQGSDSIGAVDKHSAGGYKAIVRHSFNSPMNINHNIHTRHPTKSAAIRHVIAYHKDKQFNGY
jgi:hypothetical protein